MTKRSFCTDETPPFALSFHWRTAADEAQDLHSISLFQTSVIEILAIHDFQIQFHRHALSFFASSRSKSPTVASARQLRCSPFT
jgi:hypothetical protein